MQIQNKVVNFITVKVFFFHHCISILLVLYGKAIVPFCLVIFCMSSLLEVRLPAFSLSVVFRGSIVPDQSRDKRSPLRHYRVGGANEARDCFDGAERCSFWKKRAASQLPRPLCSSTRV